MVLRAILEGTDVPEGLVVDTDLRWTLLSALASAGEAGEDEIAAELVRDPTAAGAKRAATAVSSRPDAAAKAAAWESIFNDETLSNHLLAATVHGFWRPDQVELLRPYVSRFFAEIGQLWSTRSTEIAHTVTNYLFPSVVIEPETVAAAERYLEVLAPSDAQHRLIAEGRDGLLRALRAQACDAAASS